MSQDNSPELRAAQLEFWQVSTNAVTRLRNALGQKSFAKLDFFIDHMNDHAEELKKRSDAHYAAHPEDIPQSMQTVQ